MGIDDSNPWDGYWEQDFPEACGGPEKAVQVVKRIEADPTLANLVAAVA